MKTKLILEIGCNHQGDISIAKKMIQEAAVMKVWAVKFQKRDIDSIPPEIGDAPRDIKTSFGPTYREHREALEFSIDQMIELKKYTESLGLVFMCSAFDVESLKGLIVAGVGYIKLPSQLLLSEEMYMEILNNYEGQLFVSTGMHTRKEIFRSKWVATPRIIFPVIMHCISIYPCSLLDLQLKLIQKLKEYDRIVGYSSHEIQGRAIPWAVVAGAEYIERHFTLDKNMKGSDHATVSSDPEEVRNIIQSIEWVEEMMGNGNRFLSPAEMKVAKMYRGDL